MPLPPPRTPQEEKAAADVARYGWHCVFLRGDEDDVLQATLGYTVGLWATYGHPELVLVGAWPDAHDVLADLVAAVQAGDRFAAGQEHAGVTFGPVGTHRRYSLLHLAHYAAGREPFEALQVLRPEDPVIRQPRLA